MTAHPATVRPFMAAAWIWSPPARPSRPMTTVTVLSRPPARSRSHDPYEPAKRAATSGVSVSPTIPRQPLTLSINDPAIPSLRSSTSLHTARARNMSGSWNRARPRVSDQDCEHRLDLDRGDRLLPERGGAAGGLGAVLGPGEGTAALPQVLVRHDAGAAGGARGRPGAGLPGVRAHRQERAAAAENAAPAWSGAAVPAVDRSGVRVVG